MKSISSFRDLIVWQKSKQLVLLVYRSLKKFPSDEKFCLVSQIKKCSISIPSNIAEGYGRNSTKDYIRFLQISKGSLYELETQLEIAKELGYLDDPETIILLKQSDEIDKILFSIIKSLSNKINPKN